jgi:hypothetical protein
MELKEFVKKVITDLDEAVSEANAETDREIRFRGVKEQSRALEFDVAVTVESKTSSGGKAGIKVFEFIEAGAGGNTEQISSTVSHVRFGVDIDSHTKAEIAGGARMAKIISPR